MCHLVYIQICFPDADNVQDPTQTLHYLHRILLTPRRHIQTDPWAGLPELTNKDGDPCPDSCRTQAWSASTLLDFLHTVHTQSR
jgi:glycogen debranching enzyme